MHHNWDQEGQFFYVSYNEQNRHIGDGWRGLYDVISFANPIIDDMPAIARGYKVSEKDINAGLAEARFMRAFAYFLLVEYWEEVPIVDKPAAKVSSGNSSTSQAHDGEHLRIYKKRLGVCCRKSSANG
jgi:hypothetical protein